MENFSRVIAYSASLTLRSTELGGLRHAWRTPTTSFRLVVGPLDVGLDIHPKDGQPLQPGAQPRDAVLYFWDPRVREFATPARPFELRYAGRKIGQGVFGELLQDRPVGPSAIPS